MSEPANGFFTQIHAKPRRSAQVHPPRTQKQSHRGGGVQRSSVPSLKRRNQVLGWTVLVPEGQRLVAWIVSVGCACAPNPHSMSLVSCLLI